MEINNTQLEEIEKIAAAAYSPREVAFMLGLNPVGLENEIKNIDSPVSMAYFKGLLSSEYAVRESILQLARNGSSPAQTTANQLFNDTRLNLLKSGFSFTER